MNYCPHLEQSLSPRIFIFYQYMPVTREGNMSYLSLTFLCEFRVYLSMEICTKKLQMEYLPTFLIHDRHLAKWEDDVNNKMIFKWTYGLCCKLKSTDPRELNAQFLGWGAVCTWGWLWMGQPLALGGSAPILV